LRSPCRRRHFPAFPACLFHHFESKQDLGYAIVDEIIRGHILEHWVKPLERSTDPVADIQKALRDTIEECGCQPTMLRLGCPLNNLAQEMSSVDEGFGVRVERIYDEWRAAIKNAFEAGLRAALGAGNSMRIAHNRGATRFTVGANRIRPDTGSVGGRMRLPVSSSLIHWHTKVANSNYALAA